MIVPKNGFPMPTAENRFQILSLHSKKHIIKKHGLKTKNYQTYGNITCSNESCIPEMYFKAKYITFITQKLDATAKKRFQILAILTFSPTWNSTIKTLSIGRMDYFKTFFTNANSCANAYF